MGISSYLETTDSTPVAPGPNCAGTGSSGNGVTKGTRAAFCVGGGLKRALKLLLRYAPIRLTQAFGDPTVARPLPPRPQASRSHTFSTATSK